MSVFVGPGSLAGLASPKLGFLRIRTPKDYLARPPVCSATEGDTPATTSTSTSAAPGPSTGPQTSPAAPAAARTPWPSSAWPRSSSGAVSPVCRECGGRGVISSAAGPLPCPSCLAWRRRPDYRPEQPLLSVKDLDLKSLDPGPQKQQVSTSSKRLEAESSMDESSGDEDGTGVDGKRKKKSRGVMTEQKRLAIKQAMQNRGPLALDHKRRISNAMRERYAADPSLRQAGKPKRCSHCGELGHNRKKCPLLVGEAVSNSGSEALDELLDRVAGKESEESGTAVAGASKACSICGSTGHNRRSCPQAAAASATSGEDSGTEETATEAGDAAAVPPVPVKVIEITEESEEDEDARLAEILAAASAVLDEEEGLEAETAAAAAPPPPPPPPQPAQQLRVLPGSGMALTRDGSLVFSLPSSPEQCVAQAAGAVLRAWDDGIRRQSLELLLPQPASAAADAWPGGIRQQFRAALPMLESLLLRLKRAEGLEGRITAEWLDEGDCVGAWQSERLAAVVFPTADTLPAVRRVDDALSGRRLMLVVNPQWQPQGQIVSDFGFGRSRRASERYVASLEEVYYLRRVRILGDEVRVLRCFPAKWQVHYVRAAGDTELVAVEEVKPTYQRLLEVLQSVDGSRTSKSWLDRALDRGYFADISAYTEGEAVSGDNGVENEAEGEVVRDIVTGEVVGRRRPSSSAEKGGGELL